MEASRSRPRLGLLLDALFNEYSSMLVAAFDAECARRNCDLICFAGGLLHSLAGYERQRNRCFELASRESVDGLIVLNLSSAATVLAQLLEGYRGLPICTVAVGVPGYPLVQADNAAGMRSAIAHLISTHGRRKIAFLRGTIENQEAETRFRAYRETLEDFGIEFEPARVILANFDGALGRAATAELLDRGVAFDALVGANDQSALGGMSLLRDRGVHVPDDVSVIGFDDSEEARGASPTLATVSQPYWEIAEYAVAAVLDQLSGKPVAERMLLPSQFVRRRSCGCLSEGAPSELPPVPDVNELPFPEAFAKLRSGLRGELARAEHAARVQSAEGWIEPALDALLAALMGGADRELMSVLDGVFSRTSAADGDLSAWQHAVSLLRRRLLPAVMRDSSRWLRMEDVWQRIRVLIADAIEREQRTLRRQAEVSAGILTDTSESLITSFDVESMPRALADRLPALEIGSAFVALYDSYGKLPAVSRMIVAYDERHLLDLPSGGLTFPTLQLIPPVFPAARRRSLVVQPLFFENNQLGFAVLELGPKRRVVYELLRELISAALKGAELAHRVAEEAAQREKAEKERLEQELEIATHIQTSILPRNLRVQGLEIAATMLPASEVGGDYYDVLPGVGGCWLGIGDVAGHGLRPGLVMMMLQSVVAALGRSDFNATPHHVLNVVNEVLYENVRERLHQDEHATLTLLRYFANGEVVFAGAHEDIVILRAATGKCELIPTIGTWVGAVRDISEVTPDQRFLLQEGDLLLLYTDGVIEATAASGEQFGIERVCRALERVRAESVEVIRDRLLAETRAFLSVQHDDIALLVARYRKEAG
ncbi:MAG TPA: SpoIIE family protein phosphatase [Polyangiaceae bacterium]